MDFEKRVVLFVVFAAPVCVFLLVWLFGLTSTQIRTVRHHQEFAGQAAQTNVLNGESKFKVLHCTPTHAQVYYHGEYGGNILSFEQQDGGWVLSRWDDTIDQTEDIMWPYLWHTAFGLVLMLLIFVPLLVCSLLAIALALTLRDDIKEMRAASLGKH